MRQDEILSIIDNAYEDARLLASRKLDRLSCHIIHICCQTLLIMGLRADVDLDHVAVRINSLCVDYIWSYLDTPEKETLKLIWVEISHILNILNSL